MRLTLPKTFGRAMAQSSALSAFLHQKFSLPVGELVDQLGSVKPRSLISKPARNRLVQVGSLRLINARASVAAVRRSTGGKNPDPPSSSIARKIMRLMAILFRRASTTTFVASGLQLVCDRTARLNSCGAAAGKLTRRRTMRLLMFSPLTMLSRKGA